MKLMFLFIMLITFFACKTIKNDPLTRLLAEKNSLEEALMISQTTTTDFDDKAIALYRSDTNVEDNFFDSASKYYGLGLKQHERLTAINFSIDSLSRTK